MTPANDNHPRLLTKKAAAAYVGVSVPTFAKWVLQGIMPVPFSVTRKWDRVAIDAVLANGETDADDGYDRRKRERDAKKAARR